MVAPSSFDIRAHRDGIALWFCGDLIGVFDSCADAKLARRLAIIAANAADDFLATTLAKPRSNV